MEILGRFNTQRLQSHLEDARWLLEQVWSVVSFYSAIDLT